MPKIKIYTTATCVFCRAEKQYFDEHKVPYEEVRVDTNPEAAQEMIRLSGQMGVPFTVITQEDGSKEGVVGFYQQKLAELAGIA